MAFACFLLIILITVACLAAIAFMAISSASEAIEACRGWSRVCAFTIRLFLFVFCWFAIIFLAFMPSYLFPLERTVPTHIAEPEIKSAVVDYIYRKYKVNLSPDDLIVTDGGYEIKWE